TPRDVAAGSLQRSAAAGRHYRRHHHRRHPEPDLQLVLHWKVIADWCSRCRTFQPATGIACTAVWNYLERAPSQPLMWGHVCLLAPLPAIIPMCPPLTRNNSLSRLLTLDMIGSDWQDGVMWSPSAMTVSRLARIRLRSTRSPRITNSPRINLSLR